MTTATTTRILLTDAAVKREPLGSLRRKTKESENSSIRSESISRHRKWRPEHLQISNEPKGLLAGYSCGCGVYTQKGKVKVTVISEQGKEAVVAILGPDEFCGEGCLTGQLLRLATAVAMTECEIMRLEKATMVRVLHEEPAFSEMFVSHLLARTSRVEADLVDQLFNSSEKRLARALHYWLILARTVDPSQSSPRSAKRRSRK